MRYILTLLLAAVAVFSGSWAYHALEPLWGYQDNDTSVYLALGLPAVVICVAAIVGIVLLLRLASPRPRRKSPRQEQARKYSGAAVCPPSRPRASAKAFKTPHARRARTQRPKPGGAEADPPKKR